jgi:hypothetical protein
MTVRVTRALFAIVAVVAGPVGVIMLIAPDETDRYFSWPIGPPPAAAIVGGFYIASAVVFGWAALRADWAEMRPLCVGVFALTIPTLIATFRHEEVFDFSRWQAVAWLALFAAAPIAYGTVLSLRRGELTGEGDRLRTWARIVVVVLAVGYAAQAAFFWADPTADGDTIVFVTPAMSGRFLACWGAFLATLAAFVVIRNRWRESRAALLALALWPLAAAVGAVRTFDDLASSRHGVRYIVGAGQLAAAGVVVLIWGRKPATASAPSP